MGAGGSGRERSGGVGSGREGSGPGGKQCFDKMPTEVFDIMFDIMSTNKHDYLKTPKLREGCQQNMSNNYVETLCRIIFHLCRTLCRRKLCRNIMSKDYVERLCRKIMSKDYVGFSSKYYVEILCRKCCRKIPSNILSKDYVGFTGFSSAHTATTAATGFRRHIDRNRLNPWLYL